MIVNFKKVDPRAVAPVRAHNTDAGFDLTATSITTEVNECGQLVLVYHTGLALEIPEGYFAALVPRSSISKKSMFLTNCLGVIDSDYRGEIIAKFHVTTDVIPAIYKEGERFAQLLILPVPQVAFEEVETLSETERGEGGYGSTDTKYVSAPAASSGYPEQKSELTNQQTETEGSGGNEVVPEQVQ